MTIATAFLRSINLPSDLAQPARLTYFQPTAKSLRVLGAVAHGEPSAATMVIAAYGSGKSLAAGVGGLLVDNRPFTWSALTPILDRLQGVDRRAAMRASRRCASNARGLVIALHGYVPDLANTLAKKAALKRLV